MARAGLISKGFVYLLLGVFVFMNAMKIWQTSAQQDKTGVLQSIQDNFAGQWLLPVLAAGLLCYSCWRFIEAYHLIRGKENIKKALRYFFSGVVYLLICYTAVKLILHKPGNNSDSEQQFASETLSKPFGEWLLGLSALILAGIGIYQIMYGWSGKYRKHVQQLSLHTSSSKILLLSGKIGYMARGVVWIVMAYLMIRAALSGSSKQAGDTSKVFSFVESSWGSPVLAVIAIGLIAYGFFNMVRARYENFQMSSY